MEKALPNEVPVTISTINGPLADFTPKPSSVVFSLKCQAAMALIKRVKKEIDEKKHQKFLEEEAKVLIETEKDAAEKYDNSVEKVLFLINPTQLIRGVFLGAYKLPVDLLDYIHDIVLNNYAHGRVVSIEQDDGDLIFRSDETKFENVFEILRDGIWVAYKPPADINDEAFIMLKHEAHKAGLPRRWAFRETAKTRQLPVSKAP